MFDQILKDRVGFGAYQLQQFAIICLVDFLDGAEFLFIQLLTPTLKKEWDITVTELSLYSSLFNFGLMLGTIFCGFLADTIGRKSILIIGSALQFGIVIATVICVNMTQMILLRFLYGLVIGMNLPISQILLTEMTPPENRGKIVIFLQLAMVMGRMWIFGLAFIFMQSISVGNWRAIAACNALPCFLCLVGAILLVQESPRFQICKGSIIEGIAHLNQIGRKNNQNYQVLDPDEARQLDEWRLQTYKDVKPEFKELFNERNLRVTWRNYLISFLFLFVLIGNLSIMGFLLDEESKSLLNFFIIELADFPAILAMITTVDKLGRLNILISSTLIDALLQVAIFIFRQKIILVGFMLFKFLAIIGFATSCILFAESYNTLHRSVGLGTTMAFGRIGGSISPLIIYPLFFRDMYLPFIVMAVAFQIMFFVVICYPIDRTNKALDEKED